jgi:hypothetical protein
MKQYVVFTSLFLLCSSLFAEPKQMDIEKTKATELGWVDEQIRAIIPARIGVAPQDINSLVEPFIFTKEIKEIKPVGGIDSSMFKPMQKTQEKPQPIIVKAPLKLSLIINSKALIDNKWYQKGDKVDGHNVENITFNSVTLVKGKNMQVLTIKNDSSNLKIKTK